MGDIIRLKEIKIHDTIIGLHTYNEKYLIQIAQLNGITRLHYNDFSEAKAKFLELVYDFCSILSKNDYGDFIDIKKEREMNMLDGKTEDELNDIKINLMNAKENYMESTLVYKVADEMLKNIDKELK